MFFVSSRNKSSVIKTFIVGCIDFLNTKIYQKGGIRNVWNLENNLWEEVKEEGVKEQIPTNQINEWPFVLALDVLYYIFLFLQWQDLEFLPLVHFFYFLLTLFIFFMLLKN